VPVALSGVAEIGELRIIPHDPPFATHIGLENQRKQAISRLAYELL
jgi:hypothetical protein